MRLGTTLLTLTLSGLLAANSLAQQGDPLDKAQPTKTKTGVKPGTAKKATPKKARVTASRRMSLAQARAAARARQTNQVVMPLNGAADPLNLANDFGGGGAGFAIGGGEIGNALFEVANQNASPGATAAGGLTGTSDTRLIRGFDGDRVQEDRPFQGGGGYAPRVNLLKGGSYIEGYGMPIRKGEIVNGGNYIPGIGVTGRTLDSTVGGTYTAGFGVVGSFDPRFSNRARDQVAGGSLVPGFGVLAGGNIPPSFGAGIPSAFGASSLPNNNFGAGSLSSGFGASPIPSGFGAGSLPSGFGASPIPGGFGVSPIPGGFGGGSLPTSFGTGAIPSGSFGAGSIGGGFR